MDFGIEYIPEWLDVVKLGLAVLVGGVIGVEREFRDKAAGFRTNIFICLGATLFTIFSIRMAGENHDATRIASNIVTGIGFLGAGAILLEGGRVRGLTTASTIWIVAALGMGIGSGEFAFSLLAAVVIIIILWFFPFIEHRIDTVKEIRLYTVKCNAERGLFARLESEFINCGLRIRSHSQMKDKDEMVCRWNAVGPPKNHDKIMEKLFTDEDVHSFEV